MEKLPEEELHGSFWLCANCFLDCVLAEESPKAEKYLRFAENSLTRCICAAEKNMPVALTNQSDHV